VKDFDRVLLIVANAGSGKTYRLVTRCLELMARGQSPDKILALTFTRKAAAEFLQKFFERLTAAIRHQSQLDKLREELDDPSLTLPMFGLVATPHRLVAALGYGNDGWILRAHPPRVSLRAWTRQRVPSAG
jgi:ATP-dependent exoDNAse (exonuclease V) beta subunit